MADRTPAQITDWNGKNGERWVANETRLDQMLAPFGQAAVAAAAPLPGEQVLDIGCGAGTTTLEIAALVGPRGYVLGVDISEQLIARARERIRTGLQVTFALSDAASAALPRRTFDLLFSRYGVMFFDDPVAAFAHMRRALKPGGRLAFVCWRGAAKNDWVRLPMGAIRELLPPQPAPDPEAPGPFAFGDPDRVTRILSDAGFADVAIVPFDRQIPFGSGADREAALDDAVDMAFQIGPLSRALADQPASLRTAAAAAVRTAFATRPGDRSVLIEGAAWIVTARNPIAD